jgi:WD40 repeat protein
MLQNEWATQIISTGDGKRIVSAGVDGRISVWDAVSGKAVKEIPLSAGVLAIALAPNGRTLAAGDAEGSVSVIDLETAKINGVFRADKHITDCHRRLRPADLADNDAYERQRSRD